MKRQFMQKQWKSVLATVMVLVAMTASAVAQPGTNKITGVVKDDAGQPIVGATVLLTHRETGRKINLKTDKKGQYFSLGVTWGHYDIVVSKDEAVLWNINNYLVKQTDNNLTTLDIDLAKEKKAAVTDGQKKMTEEQKKEMEKITAENTKIGTLNKMLGEAQAAMDAGNFDQAITTYKAAADADPSRDLLWARLGNAYITAAKKSTDTAARKQYYVDGAASYTKAVDILTAAPAAGAPAKTPPPPATLGAYYNNLGEALSKSGDNPGALAAYEKAAEADPTNAAMYYFNEGATLTNSGKVDDALKAYDKAIAADPLRADAYYYRGINLLSKATMKGNEMVPAPGTAEAFNKYLELEPEGSLAGQAKEMLAAIGAKIETSYGKSKKKK